MDDDDRNNRPRGKFIYSSVAVTDDSDLTEVRPGLFYHRAKGPIPEPEPEPEIRSIRVREPFIPCAACPDRQIRREAWATIFEELGADRLSERLDLARLVIGSVKDYRFDLKYREDRRPAKDRRRTRQKMRHYAEKLAGLIEGNPHDDHALFEVLSQVQNRQVWTDEGGIASFADFDGWLSGFVAALNAVSEVRAEAGVFEKRGKPLSFRYFVRRLGAIYTGRTGLKL